MPRKRIPIFHKVSSLFKVSIFVSKMRKKPIIPKLIWFRKSRNLKGVLLLKHRNYGFVEDYEYEFSASSTPLIAYRKKQLKNGIGKYRDNLFLLCRCLGGDRGGDHLDYALRFETTAAEPIPAGEYLQPLDLGNEDEESVDQRAERFIERFYQEMRMQRRESI